MEGNVISQGDVNCKDVEGNVSTALGVVCGDVEGGRGRAGTHHMRQCGRRCDCGHRFGELTAKKPIRAAHSAFSEMSKQLKTEFLLLK